MPFYNTTLTVRLENNREVTYKSAYMRHARLADAIQVALNEAILHDCTRIAVPISLHVFMLKDDDAPAWATTEPDPRD